MEQDHGDSGHLGDGIGLTENAGAKLAPIGNRIKNSSHEENAHVASEYQYGDGGGH